MSDDNYLNFPLGLIRISEDSCAFFNDAASCAVVNAGIGCRKLDEDAFNERLVGIIEKNGLKPHSSEAEAAVVGAAICKVTLGDKSGKHDAMRYLKIKQVLGRDVTVRVASRFFWAACYTARYDAGYETDNYDPSHRIDWREFRVLVALLSCPFNSREFSVVGWEGVQHRSCGFYKKEHFQQYSDSDEYWPDHCQPFTRKQIRYTLEKLESLRFFIRFRISEGGRGGLTAYSFRHPGDDARKNLAGDVAEWQSFNRGDSVREARADDLLLQANARAAFEERLEKKQQAAEAILSKLNSAKAAAYESATSDLSEVEKPPANPHKSMKGPSDGQVGAKVEANPVAKGGANIMRNPVEKSLKDKSQTRNTGTEQRIRAAAPPLDQVVEVVVKVQEESGYFIQNQFMTIDQATRLMTDNRERALDIIKTAKRGRLINGVFLPD